MDLYNIIANWTGWPVVIAVLLLGVGYGYWVMENRIQLLKDKIELLTTELSIAKQFSPDLLLENLAKRHKLISEELEMLSKEKDQNLELIVEKQKELDVVKEGIKKSIATFEKLEKKFPMQLCAYCEAPATRSYIDRIEFEWLWKEGIIETIVMVYECELEITEHGRIIKECSRKPIGAKKQPH